MLDMKRREFIALLGGGGLLLTAKVRRARAQQPGMPVIGFLHGASPVAWADPLRGFHRGLKDVGFVEGENVAIVYRWAEGQLDRLPALAAELVRRQVSVIAAFATATALAAKAVGGELELGIEPIEQPCVQRLPGTMGGQIAGGRSS